MRPKWSLIAGFSIWRNDRVIPIYYIPIFLTIRVISPNKFSHKVSWYFTKLWRFSSPRNWTHEVVATVYKFKWMKSLNPNIGRLTRLFKFCQTMGNALSHWFSAMRFGLYKLFERRTTANEFMSSDSIITFYKKWGNLSIETQMTQKRRFFILTSV